MRVIAGDLKGRRLKKVPDKQTRPTSDRVKEAVFHMMGPFFKGGICLDLFAGSGSLGIEALSRGVDFAVFIDRSNQAIQTITHNIHSLHIKNQTEVIRMDAQKALPAQAEKELQFDLILIDPPYRQVNYERIINKIIKLNILKENGLIYCEHVPQDDLPLDLKELSIYKQGNYGKTTSITIYIKNK